MKYAKPALSIEQQVAQLLQRGMTGDETLMKERLASVSYYRLSGYWFPFRQPDDSFRRGTTFEAVWERYAFDRALRLIVMDAVERIEIAVRTKLSYHHAHAFGPFGYAGDPLALPKLNVAERMAFVARIRDEVARCKKEQFVNHFTTKYGDSHQDLPIWMATEVMSFGTVLSLYDGSLRSRRAPGWQAGMPRTEAKRRTIEFARGLGVPAGWKLEGTSFGTVGREVWPRSAQAEFAPTPFGHPFLLGGDGARISLDPKSGAIRSYAYHDGTKLARLPVRLTPKRAVARARAERKEGTGSAVLTPPRLGWSPVGETWGGTQRLAYAVALTGETIRVDAYDGRILGRRRNR